MPQAAWFSGYLICAYVIAWVFFAISGLDELAGQASGWFATHLLNLATPGSVSSQSSHEGMTFLLEGGNRVSVDTRLTGKTTPLLFAVVIALSQRSIGRTCSILACGTVAILTLDGLALSGQIWASLGDAASKNMAYHLLGVFSIWKGGGWSLIPIFVAVLAATDMHTGWSYGTESKSAIE